MKKLAQFCVRRRWYVLAIWVALFIGVSAVASSWGAAYSDNFSLPGTDSVKAIQEAKGSRKTYARMEENGSWETAITPDLAAFIASQTSVFLATANADGQPYIQHRGGPAGFLRVAPGGEALAFADLQGNRQKVTLGNLAGGDIYRQILPFADRIYLSEVDAEAEGDTHFPELDDKDWQEVRRDPRLQEAGDEAGYVYRVLERRR